MPEGKSGSETRLDVLRQVARDLRLGTGLLRRLPFRLRRRITLEEARAGVRRRLENRPSNLLEIARRAIYPNPHSPYRRLLDAAGCEYGDLVELVEREGVEGALTELYRNGVYLTVDEFKGRRPAIRGSTSVIADPSRLRNPLARGCLLARSSGSRSQGTITAFDLGFVRDCAANASLVLAARGGEDWLKADWEGHGGGATFRLMKYAMFGSPPSRWFVRLETSGSWYRNPYALNAAFMRWGSRFGGVRMPTPIFASHEDPLPVIDWMADTLRAGDTPHLFGYVSSCVRVCRRASDLGIDIRGARFTVGGEPFNAARQAVFEIAGADVQPRYGSIETGAIGYGCLSPAAPDDVHVLSDFHGIIQPESGPAGQAHSDALYVTSLLPSSPFTFLNVSMGDQATLRRRRCGCALEQHGWDLHLSSVLSYEKLTAGGLTLHDADIVTVLEEVLPARFGGAPTHYQLVEEDTDGGQPSLTLLVHPDAGPSSTEAIRRAFVEAVGRGHGIWETPGFFQVERRPPLTTGTGKILHLHQSRQRE